MQFVKKSLEIIEQKIDLFNSLSKEDQELNKFLLRTSLSDLVYFTSYFIYQVGKELNIAIRPSESIESKFKKITYWEENFFTKREKEYIQSIITHRHKLAHNDTYFPNLKSVKSALVQFEKYILSIVNKVDSYNRSLDALQNRIKELKDFLKKVKIILPEQKIELVKEYENQIEIIAKIFQNTSKHIQIKRENVYEIFNKITKHFPFTLKWDKEGYENKIDGSIHQIMDKIVSFIKKIN